MFGVWQRSQKKDLGGLDKGLKKDPVRDVSGTNIRPFVSKKESWALVAKLIQLERHRVLGLRSAAAHAPARATRALTCALEAASAVLLWQVPLPVESTLPSPSVRRCAWIQLLIVLFCAGDHLSMLPPAFQLRRISTHLAIAGQPAHALDFSAGKAILWNWLPLGSARKLTTAATTTKTTTSLF